MRASQPTSSAAPGGLPSSARTTRRSGISGRQHSQRAACAWSPGEAARDKELAVVTIPEKNIPSLPAGLFAGADGRLVVIDTGNYYPRQRDGRIEAIEAGLPESRWVERQLGHAVVKVFNNIYARHLLGLGKPPGAPGRI